MTLVTKSTFVTIVDNANYPNAVGLSKKLRANNEQSVVEMSFDEKSQHLEKIAASFKKETSITDLRSCETTSLERMEKKEADKNIFAKSSQGAI